MKKILFFLFISVPLFAGQNPYTQSTSYGPLTLDAQQTANSNLRPTHTLGDPTTDANLLKIDSSGRAFVLSLSSYSYTDVTSSTYTVVKASPGFLHTLTINAVGSGITLTLYDNITNSGTKIATITPVAGATYVWDAAFSTGFTVNQTSTTAGDYTFTWK